MLKSSVVIGLFLLTFSAFAQDEQPRHMVMFGGGFDTKWSGSATKYDIDSKSAAKSFDASKGNFSLNYAYRIAPQFQIGLMVDNEVKKEEVKRKASQGGGKVVEESKISSLAVFGIFNFSEKMEHSFYLGAAIGLGNIEVKSEDTTNGANDKSDSDSDATLYHVAFGKRFPLTFMGIQNLTYSPNISYQKIVFRGDMKKANILAADTFELNILKFDLLF